MNGNRRSVLWPIAVALAAPPVAWLAVHGVGLRPAPMGWREAALGFVVAPVVEEWIFRALLQRGIAERLAARGWANRGAALVAAGTATLAFAAAHVFRFDVASWFAVWPWIVPGAALAAVYALRRRVGECMLLHAWFNLALAWAGTTRV